MKFDEINERKVATTATFLLNINLEYEIRMVNNNLFFFVLFICWSVRNILTLTLKT
jgi:hypothetical protein